MILISIHVYAMHIKALAADTSNFSKTKDYRWCQIRELFIKIKKMKVWVLSKLFVWPLPPPSPWKFGSKNRYQSPNTISRLYLTTSKIEVWIFGLTTTLDKFHTFIFYKDCILFSCEIFFLDIFSLFPFAMPN